MGEKTGRELVPVGSGRAVVAVREGKLPAMVERAGPAMLAYSSWRVRPWAWPMTLVVYGIGVFGSLWQVSVGIPQGWIAAGVNATVFLYASTPGVRRAYMGR